MMDMQGIDSERILIKILRSGGNTNIIHIVDHSEEQ